MLGLCLRSYWIEMASTTLLYTLREAQAAQLLFWVSHAGHCRSTRYRHTIGLKSYTVLFTIQFFILRGISRFYPFTSDSSTGPYLKPPNFGFVNSGIFWRSYQHLGMELGAQVILSLVGHLFLSQPRFWVLTLVETRFSDPLYASCIHQNYVIQSIQPTFMISSASCGHFRAQAII
ncbi:hypothetical protein MVEN_00322000 [Mycena venus]|uniref:Uncharacterized protein n=1 Tax=Mycena venus TaxID=2733690 RepID=A0A8H6YNU4_9AGAR|nr:hypothetical protein MVEN_00322000 [Mycena venus]